MPARAGIVVTGTEVLTGRVRDRNGPWLSDRLLELGVELAHITICGDRPEDMTAQLRFMADQGVDLVITSGGLGPTADDKTIEMVADFTGRPLALDEDLEERIADILRPLMKRFRHLDFDAVRAANRKQALVPEGAHVIYPAGTAPGLVVPGSRRSSSCRDPRASCTRCGLRRWKRISSKRRSVVEPATASRRCACSASPSPRSPRRCAWRRGRSTASTRSRSPPACAAPRSRW
jgi:molybdenum cofactor synthesis domain-containing protein